MQQETEEIEGVFIRVVEIQPGQFAYDIVSEEETPVDPQLMDGPFDSKEEALREASEFIADAMKDWREKEIALSTYAIDIKVKKLHPDARLPFYASDGAAGADLYALENFVVPAESRTMARTGIAVEIPLGFEIQVRPRSGLAAKEGITVLNSPGTIDSDYRGEICVILHNTSPWAVNFQKGDRIAQIVVAPVFTAVFTESDRLGETTRGEGGFGSTGGKAV
jgi:dUTP pyrophosphatase